MSNRITPFLCQITAMNEQVGQAINSMAQQCDSKQYAMAGCDLGKI
jgi:hypothetical protein